jgi:predicted PurR-regulated permease PerM
VGTSLIWLPLSIAHFSSHPGWQSVGLLLYSVIVIGNVDYLARISILKRIGDVHPIITIIGVVLGLKLFGFWGFIFGPLLISAHAAHLFQRIRNDGPGRPRNKGRAQTEARGPGHRIPQQDLSPADGRAVIFSQ